MNISIISATCSHDSPVISSWNVVFEMSVSRVWKISNKKNGRVSRAVKEQCKKVCIKLSAIIAKLEARPLLTEFLPLTEPCALFIALFLLPMLIFFAFVRLLCWTLENVLWLDYISIETKHLFMVRNVLVRACVCFSISRKMFFVRKNSRTHQSIHWHTQMVLSQFSSICYCRWPHKPPLPMPTLLLLLLPWCPLPSSQSN